MVSMADRPALMIVDDEPNFTESLRLAIEDAYRVSVAGSLKRAREALSGSMPDAILLDLRLPDGNGVEFLRELEAFSQLPVVIIMTAFGTVDSFIQSQHGGAFDYFTKPLDISELKKALRIALGRKNIAGRPPRPQR
jgi:DNA-binding NtrC family response regulator